MTGTHQESIRSWTPRRPKVKRVNGFVRALSIVVEQGRRAAARSLPPPMPSPMPSPKPTKSCPRCGHCGDVESDFGFRKIAGETRPQSWCRGCRSAVAKARQSTPDLFGPVSAFST